MVYGELCRFLLEVQIKMKMERFWYKLVSNESKLSGRLHKLMKYLQDSV